MSPFPMVPSLLRHAVHGPHDLVSPIAQARRPYPPRPHAMALIYTNANQTSCCYVNTSCIHHLIALLLLFTQHGRLSPATSPSSYPVKTASVL